MLDILLLHAAFAVGLSIACSIPFLNEECVRQIAVGSAFPEGEWYQRVTTAVVIGSLAAGPIVLFFQWAWRGRRSLLSVGELLWLGSAASGTVLSCVVLVESRALHHEQFVVPFVFSALVVRACLLLLAMGHTVCLLVGCLPLLVQAFSRKPREVRANIVPCRWTHRFGAVASLCWGMCLWYFVLSIEYK